MASCSRKSASTDIHSTPVLADTELNQQKIVINFLPTQPLMPAYNSIGQALDSSQTEAAAGAHG